MNLHDWIDELCDTLEVSTEVDEGLVADLTRIVGKTVQPSAGPVTAYLLGYAAATGGDDPERVEQLAARAQDLAEGWDRPPGSHGENDDEDDDEVAAVLAGGPDLADDEED